MSEAGSGSDVMSMKLTATKDGKLCMYFLMIHIYLVLILNQAHTSNSFFYIVSVCVYTIPRLLITTHLKQIPNYIAFRFLNFAH